SPCREERTPSFHVNTRKGVWHDFGTGHGGDIFTLAGELSGSDGFMAQARFIAGVYGGTIPEYAGQKKGNGGVRAEKRKEASRFEEVVRSPLYCNVLLGYLKGRGIPAEIARAECEEVRFRLYGKRYFAVGFRNMSGGYELRTRFMKWCLPPKDISLIRNGSLTCNLFEGFIDFLSWKVLGISRDEDYLVLNSVALLERSFPYLDHYGKIRCYLDNDDTGKRTLADLRKRYGDRIDDCSDLYAGYKDLNEYLGSNFPLEQ
ncbi:toprim domain-containing protein, partial [Barnesiella sp. An22]|uniref:toprim domain-containing protein n=1 Tax=Barnesiella sp. An22 TaxID=1965590 RepID=UPI000B39E3B8